MVNAGEIAHMSHGDISKPLIGEDMGDKDLNIFSKGLGILIEGGLITSIADSEELVSEYFPSWDGDSEKSVNKDIIDAKGGAIIPGFVDSHTHLIGVGIGVTKWHLGRKGYHTRKFQN